ncbi:MAG TPA: secretion protein [Polyangia bacterium]|nr:secretion protein [Polyangia bacterium]
MVPGRRGRVWGIAVLAWVVAGCSTSVLHGIDERAANEATAALERAGIGAEKVADDALAGGPAGATFTVRVTSGDASRAVDLLHALGLPRQPRRGFAETYGQPSLIPTPSEERARYLNATAGEIEKTLETIDGVVSARVHLALEEQDPLSLDGKPREESRAAVLLKARPGSAPIAERDVQKLVAGSVAGLEPTAVGVVVTPAAEPQEPGGVPLTPLGPLRISAGTRPVLIAALIAVLALLGVLAALLLVLARRLAALEQATPAATSGPSTGVVEGHAP